MGKRAGREWTLENGVNPELPPIDAEAAAWWIRIGLLWRNALTRDPDYAIGAPSTLAALRRRGLAEGGLSRKTDLGRRVAAYGRSLEEGDRDA